MWNIFEDVTVRSQIASKSIVSVIKWVLAVQIYVNVMIVKIVILHKVIYQYHQKNAKRRVDWERERLDNLSLWKRNNNKEPKLNAWEYVELIITENIFSLSYIWYKYTEIYIH